MRFTDAGGAEIIRASQKDFYYLSHLRRCVADCVQSILGPGIWIKWRHDLDLLADLGYFGLTTIAGLQTLGEEYVNIVQVDGSKRFIPSTFRRIILVLLHVFTPYLIKRLLNYWENKLRGDPNIESEHKKKLLNYISICRQAVTLVHRCHLAFFYIQGVFYQLSKRISGIHYLLVRSGLSNTEGVPSFHWLGYLSLLQLSVSALQQCMQHVRGNLSVEEEVPENKDSSDDYVPSSRRCPLCLESRCQSTVTPCGHVFCWTCITEWINTKKECPLCRDKFGLSRLVVLQNYDQS